MKNILAKLIGKKYSVYVGDEFERMTDFIGFMKLLANYSDFFDYDKQEQRKYLKKAESLRYGYICENIYVKISS